MSVLSLLDKKRIASKLNMNVIAGSGRFNSKDVVVPKGIRSVSNLKDFSSAWERALNQNSSLATRKVRLDAYERMLTYGAITARAVETYTNEALNINKSHLPAINFTVNDPKIESMVREVLEINDLISNDKIKQDVSSICAMGDIAYILKLYRDNGDTNTSEPSMLTESISIKSDSISEPFSPHQIQINYASPQEYSLEAFQGDVYSLKIDNREKKEYDPWEFVLFSLSDRKFFPHGKSVLEAARIPFEVLSVSEQLMYFCRASKVDRLVIKYPEGSDPVTDFENSVLTRSEMNNARWMSGMGNPNQMNRDSDTALNTMWFVPDTLTLEQLRSPIDVASIDDVEYLMKKMVMALGIPKNFLIAEETMELRSQPLSEQDYTFASALPFIQTAYLDGMKKLITLISYYLGADMNHLHITVEITQPGRINSRYVEQYESCLNLIQHSLAFFREIDPEYALSFADLKVMLHKAGVDPEIFNIPSFIKKHKDKVESEGGEFGVGENPLDDLSGLGGDNLGEPEAGFDASDIGTSPMGESKKYSSNLNYTVSLNENLQVHSKLYKCFVRGQ